jgi:quercetin dioxygenase-like cupin family protein
MNTYHNKDFVFNCPFQFKDRYHGQEDYFSGKGRLCKSANLTILVWDSNFIFNVLDLDLIEWKERGEGKSLYFELADNSLSAHIAEFPVGTYKKAHSHGHGAHIIVLTGKGYTLFWEEGQRIRRVDWKAGSFIIPPEEVVHQHFNTGDTPAKYIALHSRSSQKHRSGRKKWRDDLPVARGGTQIEYEDEDPMIRETFEKELQKAGIECHMPKTAK